MDAGMKRLRSADGPRSGVIRPGCLIWGALILLVGVMAWKMIDFHMLRPAAVKAAVNDAYDSVRGFRGTETERRSTCREAWDELQSTTDNRQIQNCVGPVGNDLTFTNESVYVSYPDTLHFPLFGEYAKIFRISRIF